MHSLGDFAVALGALMDELDLPRLDAGDFARPLLQAMGVDGHFPVISAGDSHPRMKPDPLPLLATCERLGVAPVRALMVGDSTNDSVAARAAGCPVALMRYGYNHGVPVDHVDCDAALDDLNELFGHPAGPAMRTGGIKLEAA